MSLRTADYDFTLPDALIARHPAPQREDARMLVLHRAEERIEHSSFREFASYLQPRDLVVLNDTRVLPARVFSDDKRVEFLFLETVGENVWKCLVKPGRRMRIGAAVSILGNRGEVQEICPEGERIVAFDQPVDLEAAGELPLPPYLDRAIEPADSERYQTVFARESGAVAAPTAGLHFTPGLLARIPHAFVTLHVGVGTFRGVHAEELTGHQMHSERFHFSAEAAQQMNAAERLVAVGTTTTRVLESCGRPFISQRGATDIFIYPPYQFRAVDVLLTNFHLPKSTLLMLVSAFAGREFVLRAYAEAVRQGYRFYSYGDCMLIL